MLRAAAGAGSAETVPAATVSASNVDIVDDAQVPVDHAIRSRIRALVVVPTMLVRRAAKSIRSYQRAVGITPTARHVGGLSFERGKEPKRNVCA